MRNLHLLDVFRDRQWECDVAGPGDGGNGYFRFKSEIDGGELRVLASSGMGWDRVSVSRSKRCPNWPEMEQIKRLLFKDNETAMQLHVPPQDHVNCHPTRRSHRPRPGAHAAGFLGTSAA